MDYHQIIHTLLLNRNKIILFTVSTSVFLFLILFFIYPISYKSEVKILPPDEQSLPGISSLIGGSDITSFFGFGNGGGNSQLFAEILKSRTVAEMVILKCNLFEYFDTEEYDTESEKIQSAFESLGKIIHVEVTKEGIIILNATLSTPLFSRFTDTRDSIKILSAKVANTFVDALDKVNQQKLNLKAKRTRLFIEDQIKKTLTKLDSAENRLQMFQEENKTISLPEQLNAAIENAAEIKSEIILTEIQLSTLEFNLLEDSKEFQSLKKRLDVLEDKYSALEYGSQEGKDYLPAFKDVPEVSIELANLVRDVKIQNEVYLLLQMQYYREKIQENKNISTIEILDAALPPLKASSPRLIFSTFIGGLFAFFLISSLVIMSELKKKREISNN